MACRLSQDNEAGLTHFDQNLGGLNNYIGQDASFLIQNLRGLRRSYAENHCRMGKGP
jgi:hypothetical protein